MVDDSRGYGNFRRTFCALLNALLNLLDIIFVNFVVDRENVANQIEQFLFILFFNFHLLLHKIDYHLLSSFVALFDTLLDCSYKQTVSTVTCLL